MTDCQHTNLKVTIMPEGSMHYGRCDCVDCGKFIDWLKNPKTIARESENLRRVKVLQEKPQNEWTKGFLSTYPKKCSPKQQAKLDELWKDQS